MDSEIGLTIVDGRRLPFDTATDVLLTARNGRQKNIISQFVKCNANGQIHLTQLPVEGNFADSYTVLLSAKHRSDAGFTPVKLEANAPKAVSLMLLPRTPKFQFDAFADIATSHPAAHALVSGELSADKARQFYDGLKNKQPQELSCLLNITTALEQMTLSPASGLDSVPLGSFKGLWIDADHKPQRDRFFAWVDQRLLKQVRDTVNDGRDKDRSKGITNIVGAPKGLHPGATESFKQVDFGEGNVQLSFHDQNTRQVNGTDCIGMEVDIDYFHNTDAHILLEVFPNTLKKKILGKDSPSVLTDPKVVYGLRWIAGKQLNVEFAPPYTIN